MYAKIFASLYQGTLRGCAHEILVFTNLIAHADATGAVDKHFRAIADETGLTVDEVKAALANLESPDPESRSPEYEGRRLIPLDDHRAWGWQIVNHGKYRGMRSEEDRREANRIAQQRYRERQKEMSSDDSNAYSNQSKPRVSTGHQSKPKQKHKQEADTEEERERSASAKREISDNTEQDQRTEINGKTAIPVNPVSKEETEQIESFLTEIRSAYNTNCLGNEPRWVDSVLDAIASGLTPKQYSDAARFLLTDKSRKYPITPANVLALAIEQRAKKSGVKAPAKNGGFLH